MPALNLSNSEALEQTDNIQVAIKTKKTTYGRVIENSLWCENIKLIKLIAISEN